MPLRFEFDGQIARDELAAARERKREEVAVRAELELEVAIVVAEQEELDDLEIPEPVAASGRATGAPDRRSRVASISTSNVLPVRASIRRSMRANSPRRSGPPFQLLANLESKALHAYAPPDPAEPGARVRLKCSTKWTNTKWQARRHAIATGSTETTRRSSRRPCAPRSAELAGPIRLRTLTGGLLHQSFHVRAGAVEYVLQRVSDVFAPEIHQNIQAVSEHLAAHGLRAARLLPTKQGELSAFLGELGRWRLMEHLGGVSFERLVSVAQARSAGELVGRFHAALCDFDAPLAPMGIPYRNTAASISTALRAALAQSFEPSAARRDGTDSPSRSSAAFESLGSGARGAASG